MTEEELNEIGAALPHVGTLKLIAEIRRLEAENVALRARAVPEVVWQDLAPELGGCAESIAKSGEFALVVYRWGDERAYSIRVDETRIRGSMPKAVSLADCKSACKAAFLRLVGVK